MIARTATEETPSLKTFLSWGRTIGDGVGFSGFSESWIWMGLVGEALKNGDFGAGMGIGSDAVPLIKALVTGENRGVGS